MDLVWQGNVYTHPFYEGRSLWTRQSRIIILAVPQIPGITNVSGLNYVWTKNSEVQGAASGVGKNYLEFSDSILGKPVTIKLSVLGLNGEFLAGNEITLSPSNPETLTYENNPLNGFMFNRELGAIGSFEKKEVTLTAFPFFYSIVGRNSGLIEYSWSTGSGRSETANTVTYRVPENSYGSARISVRTSNKDKVMQNSRRSFLINFEK